MSTSKSSYYFFWKETAPGGWASQWYDSPFVSDDTLFATAEHYMMWRKAKLFDDDEIAQEILEAKHPRDVRTLGRKVKDFTDEAWNSKRFEIVVEASRLKFGQHEELSETLLSTGDKIIVEASPRDRIWGIGYGEKNALANQAKWGTNLLGKALMQVRQELEDQQAASGATSAR